MQRRAAILLAMLTALPPCTAMADPPVAIRQGRHGEMGRLVFAFPCAETFQSRRNGSQLTIAFMPAVPIGAVALHIPGLEAMQGGAGVVRLQLSDGVTPRIYRLGNRVVVDAGPNPAGPREAKTRPAPPPPAAPTVPIPVADGAMPAAFRPAAMVQPALPAPGLAVTPDVSTPDVSTPDVSTPATAPVLITFATQPGAAAFRRGGLAILVFDTSEIPDLSALPSVPLFAGATLLSLQDAQVITIPLPEADSLAIAPVAGGWQVAAVPAVLPGPAPPQVSTSAVEFPMQSANQSIIIADPLTGGDLLVGTVTQSRDAADFSESGPGFDVLPAWAGVVIVPQSDSLGLNASLKGFELVSGAPGGLRLGILPPQAIAASAPPGQGLNLPGGSTAALWQRLLADQRAAAILPPLGRLNAQIALARDMLALGMGPEASGVLDTAVLENPAAADNGQIAQLRAVADVVSHRSRPADFSAPGLIPGPELTFWQAAGALDRGETRQALPGLIAGLPRFTLYPDALRDTMTAEIAEALADNGQPQAAQQLTAADPGNPLLDLARAKILEDQGQAKPALAAYQVLARGADQRVAAIANARIVELRLAAGGLNDGQAADALDAQLFDWREAGHERRLRLRIAKLRADAGQWPQAFTMLAAARSLFPGHRRQIDAARAAMFLRMLGSNGFTQLSPIDAVAVLEQNQDLVPAGGDNTQLIRLLAQRLDALDLPGAAAPMLSHLIQTIPPGPAQASLGATLAQVDLDAGSPVAALADLAQTQAGNLPPDLARQRDMLAAKAQAAGGNAIAAMNSLAPDAGGPPAPNAGMPDAQTLDMPTLEAQAQIAEQSGQWQPAEQALSRLVSQSVPASGPIGPDQENLLLRLATAASHTGDAATLAALAGQYGNRVGTDPAGQMFQTLTAVPLTGDQGLNQALHEIAQLQALPAMLNALSGHPTNQPAAVAVPR